MFRLRKQQVTHEETGRNEALDVRVEVYVRVINTEVVRNHESS